MNVSALRELIDWNQGIAHNITSAPSGGAEKKLVRVVQSALERIEKSSPSALKEHPFLVKSLIEGASLVQNEQSPKDAHYHNHEHFAQALMAVSYLAEHEFKTTEGYEKLLALNAMLFHDFGHDAGTNQMVPTKSAAPEAYRIGQESRLEKLAFEKAKEVFDVHGVAQADQEILREVILNTDPARTVKTKQAYALLHSAPSSANSTEALSEKEKTILRVSAICNDADVLFSLLPAPGLRLGKSLAKEWESIDHPQKESVSTFEGRLGFLNFFKPYSRGAQSLGLHCVVEKQVEIFEQFGSSYICPSKGDMKGRRENPETQSTDHSKKELAQWGAKYLDLFPFNLSVKSYMKKFEKELPLAPLAALSTDTLKR